MSDLSVGNINCTRIHTPKYSVGADVLEKFDKSIKSINMADFEIKKPEVTENPIFQANKEPEAVERPTLPAIKKTKKPKYHEFKTTPKQGDIQDSVLSLSDVGLEKAKYEPLNKEKSTKKTKTTAFDTELLGQPRNKKLNPYKSSEAQYDVPHKKASLAKPGEFDNEVLLPKNTKFKLTNTAKKAKHNHTHNHKPLVKPGTFDNHVLKVNNGELVKQSGLQNEFLGLSRAKHKNSNQIKQTKSPEINNETKKPSQWDALVAKPQVKHPPSTWW